MLEALGSALALANSAKSLLGGVFGGSKDEGDSMKSQYAWNAYSTLNLPYYQVAGLRKAGLNPMLAISKGIQAAPGITSAPGTDSAQATARQTASTQAMVAAAQVENLRANSAKSVAEADLAKAQAESERHRPENIQGQTGLYRSQALLHDITGTLVGQQGMTETERTKLVKAEAYLKDFEAMMVQNYGPQKADLLFRQIKAHTQVTETEAASAKGLEEAYKTMPAEVVSIIRLIRSIFHPGSPGRYFNQ